MQLFLELLDLDAGQQVGQFGPQLGFVAFGLRMGASHDLHGHGLAFVPAQAFTQHGPGLGAMLVELRLQPRKQGAVRRRLGAQRGMVFLRQMFQKAHVRQQQPCGMVHPAGHGRGRQAGLGRPGAVVALFPWALAFPVAFALPVSALAVGRAGRGIGAAVVRVVTGIGAALPGWGAVCASAPRGIVGGVGLCMGSVPCARTSRSAAVRVVGRCLAPQGRQVVGGQLRELGQLAQQLAAQHAVRQRRPQRAGVAGHVGAALGGGQVAAVAGCFDQEAAQRHGLGNAAGEGVGAVFAHIAVGVVLGGQKQELDAARIRGVGQGAIERLTCRAAPGSVAVKAEHHGIGKTQQLLYMLGCAGGAQRGHGVGKAQLGQGHHVHVALGHQRIARLADGGAGLEQAIQLAAFVEDRGFG